MTRAPWGRAGAGLAVGEWADPLLAEEWIDRGAGLLGQSQAELARTPFTSREASSAVFMPPTEPSVNT